MVFAALCCGDTSLEDGSPTPLGAQRAGNAAGTIPPWSGGITQPPGSYRPGYHETHPFPADKPLFQINASNAAQYAQQLTPGQLALLQRYPDTWYMNVYETRRTASFPDYVYDAIAENAASAQVLRRFPVRACWSKGHESPE